MSFPGLLQDLGSSPAPVMGFYRIAQTLTPTAVGANTTSEQTFAVPGVMPGDSVDINKASHQTGLGILNVVVKNPNQLSITYVNTTGGSITPTSEQYIIGGMR
jgi:hypothetical protein